MWECGLPEPMQRSWKGVALALAIAVVGSLAASGSSTAATVEVRLAGAVFTPSTININASDTVVFVNDDTIAHDVLFKDGFGSGTVAGLAPGANWSHTFASNATFEFKFRCQVHSGNFDVGMVGKVVVAGSTPPPPQPPKSPGFEILGVIVAVGAAALFARRPRRA